MKNNEGVNICDVLAVVFVVLKLCKIIKWSWLWVLSPLWILGIIKLLIILYFNKRYEKNGKI